MPLKILVTAKRVEDPESRIRVRADGQGIVTDGLTYRMNPFDEIAVEEALRLRERHGGEVVAISVGGVAVEAELRAALALGADRALRVGHEGPLDPLVVSALLARVVADEKADLVLAGKQAIDDDEAQTGPYLAERLGWPQVTFASKKEPLDGEEERRREPGLVLSPDGKALVVVREVDGGLERVRVLLPAVVTSELRLNKPRFATLPNVMKSKRAKITEVPAASLGVDLTPRVVVRRMTAPPARKPGVRVADVDELYRKLHEEAKVL